MTKITALSGKEYDAEEISIFEQVETLAKAKEERLKIQRERLREKQALLEAKEKEAKALRQKAIDEEVERAYGKPKHDEPEDEPDEKPKTDAIVYNTQYPIFMNASYEHRYEFKYQRFNNTLVVNIVKSKKNPNSDKYWFSYKNPKKEMLNIDVNRYKEFVNCVNKMNKFIDDHPGVDKGFSTSQEVVRRQKSIAKQMNKHSKTLTELMND